MARRKPDGPVLDIATPFTEGLALRVLEFIRGRGGVRQGERVLVGVSGGPDSTALLLILARLRTDLWVELTVAHFDHMLRGPKDAAADEAFVRGLAGALGLPVVCGRGNVAARARRAGESVEEAARHLRYAFLARQAKRLGARLVALGHTRDDRAETVLLHLLRGSGLDGLVAMRPRSRWPFGRGPDVARPLLEFTRRETERYCREAGVRPRQDRTNELLIATRNRLRHEVLPGLRRLNPRIDDALVRLADGAAIDVDYLDAHVEEAWARLARKEKRGISFPRDDLTALHPALAARLLRRAVSHLSGGSVADLEASHVQAVLGALDRRRSRVSLPHGLTVTVGSRALHITRGELPSPGGMPPTPLAVPGRTCVGRWSVDAEVVPPPAEPDQVGPLEAFLDADAVEGGLAVRSRHPGDRLRPLALGGEKKLQDVLVDAKVPVEERDSIPLVCAHWGIAWVVGHRIDERAALTPATRRVLHLRFRRRQGR